MAVPYELHLALRYLRFHRGRTFLSIITLISVAGVTLGTAALVIALSVMSGFVKDVRERIHSGSAHLTVLSAEHPELFEGAEELAARLEALPGVRAAAPVVYTPALLTLEELGSHGFAELHGIESAAHTRVIPESGDGVEGFDRLDGPTPSGREGILLGEELRSRMGAKEGDLVRVLVPRLTLLPWGAAPLSRLYEVVGSYRSEHFQEDAIRAYLSLAAARGLLRAEGQSSWVEVRIDDLRQIQPMKERLRGELGGSWLVVDLIEQNRDILRALQTEKLISFLLIGLIVVVAASNILSTLVLMVSDKVKDIGTLTALGARPVGIARVFVLQGLTIGVVGSIAGLTLGVAACFWLDRYRVIKLDPDVYYLNYVPFDTQPLDLVFVGLAALAISLLATIYPALKAARLDPLEAIRFE